jgi:hypothetical protein
MLAAHFDCHCNFVGVKAFGDSHWVTTDVAIPHLPFPLVTAFAWEDDIQPPSLQIPQNMFHHQRV